MDDLELSGVRIPPACVPTKSATDVRETRSLSVIFAILGDDLGRTIDVRVTIQSRTPLATFLRWAAFWYFGVSSVSVEVDESRRGSL